MSSRRWAGPALAVAGVVAVVIAGLQLLGEIRDEPETPSATVVPAVRDDDRPARDADRPRVRADGKPAPGGPVIATAADKVTRIVVRVTDATTSRPIARARVEAAISVKGGALGWFQLSTDADGLARIERPYFDHAEIVCRAHGHVRAASRADVEGGEEATVEIALAPAVTVEGLVVRDENGVRIPGARIEAVEGGVHDGTTKIVQQTVSALGATTTDDRGAFVLDCLTPDEVVTLRVTAPGRASANVPLTPPAVGRPAGRVEIRLEPGGRVHGVVRHRNGDVSPHASVYLVLADAPALLKTPDSAMAASVVGHLAVLHAQAGDDGAYAVDGVRLGVPYYALADSPGNAAMSEPVPSVEVTAERPDAVVNLVVRDLGALDLTVLTAAGAPVAAAKVELRHARGTTTRTSGADGRVLANGLELGQWVVTVRAANLPKMTRAYAVEEGRTRTAEIRLPSACAIEGVVVDDVGNAVAGAGIEASRPPWEDAYKGLPSSEGKAVSDAEGRFRIGGLLEGPHEVRAQETNHDATAKLRSVAAPAAGVRVVSPRRGTIRFRLVAPAGAARPAEIYVCVESVIRRPAWSDGAIEFAGLVPGTTRLQFRIAGFAAFERRVDVKPGETTDLGDIALDPGHALRGRVEGADGRPVAGVVITTGDPLTPTHQKVTTGADGTFVLEHLAAGPNHVQVQADGFLALDVPVDVRAGDGVTTVRLARGGLLRGTVRRADASLVPDARVHVVDDAAKARGADMGHRQAWPRTDARGVFETRLAAGRYKVTIELKIIGRTVIRAETDADLAEGGTTPIVVDLPE